MKDSKKHSLNLNNFIPWAGCDDNTNKSSIYFLVVLSFHLELNISDYIKFDIFDLSFIELKNS